METQEKPDEQPKAEVAGEVNTETISRTDSTVRTLMTVGGDDTLPGQNMTVSTVSLQTATAPAPAAAKLVKVLISYPDKWKRPKHLQNGEVYSVSPESADQFIREGFATLVKEDKS